MRSTWLCLETLNRYAITVYDETCAHFCENYGGCSLLLHIFIFVVLAQKVIIVCIRIVLAYAKFVPFVHCPPSHVECH